jgi:uncharacterized membrane protein
MKLTKTSGALIAATAATLLLGGVAMSSTAKAAEMKAGHCVGVNACKGNSSCKTASSSCKGQNACKGQGFVELSEDQCKQVGGKFEMPAG